MSHLSPGKWHRFIPKTPRENVAWRLRMYRAAAESENVRAGLRAICKQDIIFYINAFVWQFNPNDVGNEIGPFICWNFQEAAILKTLRWNVEDRQDVIWEKSRELGATWCALIADDWLCLLHRNKNILDISHNEKAVDDADNPDCLFEKVRFMHRHLPTWLLGNVENAKLKFNYHDTWSHVNGSSTSERSGVGGRRTKLTLDEFSKHREDYAIWGQTADVGPRLVIGTHYGLGSCFTQLTKRRDVKKIVMHWSQHPEKAKGLYKSGEPGLGWRILDKDYEFPPDYKFDTSGEPFGGPYPGIRSPWYDAECKRRNSKRDVAMHLDINPEGAASQFFDPATINDLIAAYCAEPLWQGDILFDQKTEPETMLVERPGGPLKLWINPAPQGQAPIGDYVIGGDVAEGVGASPSCFSIGDVNQYKKIGEYTNAFIDPKDLAHVINALGRLFKNNDDRPAKVGWEIPGPGKRFGRTLMDLGYWNVFYRTRTDKLSNETTELVGWVNTADAAREMLGSYRMALFARVFENPSRAAMEETLKFEYDDNGCPKHGEIETGDPSGAGVNHGDHVIADGITSMMMKKMDKPEKRKEFDEKNPPVGSLAWRRLHRPKSDEMFTQA